MIIGKLVLAKLKEKGIDNAEKIAKDVFLAIKEASLETAVHADANATEKMICMVAGPVIAGLEAQVDAAIDFDKDGKVG